MSLRRCIVKSICLTDLYHEISEFQLLIITLMAIIGALESIRNREILLDLKEKGLLQKWISFYIRILRDPCLD